MMKTNRKRSDRDPLPCMRELSPERRALAEQWIPAGFKLSMKWERKVGAEKGEFLAAAWAALSNAAEKFDPGRGLKFSTLAYCAINRRLMREARYYAGFTANGNRTPEQRTASLSGEYMGAEFGRWDDRLLREVGVGWWAELEQRLDPRLWRVLQMRFIDGLTLREISRRIGLVPERVRQLEVEGLREARKVLGGEESGGRAAA